MDREDLQYVLYVQGLLATLYQLANTNTLVVANRVVVVYPAVVATCRRLQSNRYFNDNYSNSSSSSYLESRLWQETMQAHLYHTVVPLNLQDVDASNINHNVIQYIKPLALSENVRIHISTVVKLEFPQVC